MLVTNIKTILIGITKLKYFKTYHGTDDRDKHFLHKLSKNKLCQRFCKVAKVSSVKTREYCKYFQKQKRCVRIQPSDLDFKMIGMQG